MSYQQNPEHRTPITTPNANEPNREESAPPPPILASEDRMLALISHLLWVVGAPIIGPLIVYLVKKDSDFVREHAMEALNAHISYTIYAFVSFLLLIVMIGAILLPALGILALITSIIAAIRASEGTMYRYPLVIRLIK